MVHRSWCSSGRPFHHTFLSLCISAMQWCAAITLKFIKYWLGGGGQGHHSAQAGGLPCSLLPRSSLVSQRSALLVLHRLGTQQSPRICDASGIDLRCSVLSTTASTDSVALFSPLYRVAGTAHCHHQDGTAGWWGWAGSSSMCPFPQSSWALVFEGLQGLEETEQGAGQRGAREEGLRFSIPAWGGQSSCGPWENQV